MLVGSFVNGMVFIEKNAKVYEIRKKEKPKIINRKILILSRKMRGISTAMIIPLWKSTVCITANYESLFIWNQDTVISSAQKFASEKITLSSYTFRCLFWWCIPAY